MRLLNEVADNETLKAVRGAASTDDEQESDRELILRFFAMAGHMRAYRMPLSNFLNDEADRGIALDAAALQQRRALFERAIGNVRTLLACPCSCRLLSGSRSAVKDMECGAPQVYAVFGEAAFRADGGKLEPSLWDTLMTTFSRWGCTHAEMLLHVV